MTFYCPIGQEMLNLVTNCCKLLKVNQVAERAVSSTGIVSSDCLINKQQISDALQAMKSFDFYRSTVYLLPRSRQYSLFQEFCLHSTVLQAILSDHHVHVYTT